MQKPLEENQPQQQGISAQQIVLNAYRALGAVQQDIGTLGDLIAGMGNELQATRQEIASVKESLEKLKPKQGKGK